MTLIGGPGAVSASGASRFPRPSTELILPNLLAKRAQEVPDQRFVTEVDGESLSYAEVHDRANRLGHGLRRLGVQPGDRVVTLLPNSVDAVVVLCATALIGAVHVPLNNAYKGALLQHAVDVAQPAILVIDVEFGARFDQGLELPEGCATLWREGPFPQAAVPSGGVTLSQVVAEPGSPPSGLPEDICDWAAISTLLFTSGTTGASKAVTIPWLHLYLSSVRIWQAHELTSDAVMYSPWPVNHISGTGAVYMTMVVGGSLVVREKWSTSRFTDDVKRYECTITTLMSESVGYLRRMEGLADLPLTHVFVAPVTDYIDDLMDRIGARYATNYNATELCSPLGTDGWSPIPVGSCGVPRDGVEIRIVDEQGADVQNGTPGEGLFRTVDPAAMNAGYWGMPDASAEAWRGGWFHTGDLLRRDADGHYYFVGRMKDRLRSRGENVSPDELEAVVLKHAAVNQCTAVGRPNEAGEDDIVLFVVATSRSSAEQIHDYCRDALPKFMWPTEVRFVDELPETPTGKIRRAEVRDALLAGKL